MRKSFFFPTGVSISGVCGQWHTRTLWQPSNCNHPQSYSDIRKQVLHECPSSHFLLHIVLSPSFWKQQKWNYRNPTAEMALFTDAKDKNTYHTSPSPSLSFSLPFVFALDCRSKWGISHTLVLWHGITSKLLFFSLCLNKMIHFFSIMAMSVWNELYNQ